MTVLQAYYTSWRGAGDDPPEVRLDAASPGLDPGVLGSVGLWHAAYRIPAQPLVAGTVCGQGGPWPVALKFRPVAGAGAVLSHTVCTGFEPGGGPTGDVCRRRFLSHVLVDVSGDGFDGLLPVELWGAGHWVADDSLPVDIAPLAPATAGPVDLAAALRRLSGPRRALLSRVLDASLAASDGTGRVVIVESDIDRAAAWVVWVCSALPAEIGRRLTFSTFDGRPCSMDPVDLCVTAPGSDAELDAAGPGGRVTVIDVERGDHSPVSLYGRVLAGTSEQGSEAITRIVQRLSTGAGRRSLGAEVTLLAGRGDLAEAADVPGILEASAAALRTGEACASVAAIAALPPPAGDLAQLRAWGELHRVARSITTRDAADLTDLALSRLLSRPGVLPADIARPVMPAPTAPTIERLAGWLDDVEQAETPEALAAHCHVGARLGLIGVNTQLDRHLAAMLGGAAEHAVVRRELAEVASAYGGEELLDLVTRVLARRARTDDAALDALVALSAVNIVRARLERLACGEQATFDDVATWQRLRWREDPALFGAGLAAMARHAADGPAYAAMRAQVGPTGPQTPAQHSELLTAYCRAEIAVPADDLEAARSLFERLDVWSDGAATLGTVLADVDPTVVDWVPWLAWDLLVRERPSAIRYVHDGVALAGRTAAGSEVGAALALAVVRRARRERQSLTAAELWDGVAALPGAPSVVIDLLRAELDGAEEPHVTAASLFGVFHAAHPPSLVEVLPGVLAGSGRGMRRKVRGELRRQGASKATIDAWARWNRTQLRGGPIGWIGGRGRSRGTP